MTVVGPFPPLRSISPYVVGLVSALRAHGDITVDVLGFRSLYPKMLYPGGEQSNPTDSPYLVPGPGRVSNALTWWNPVGWLRGGLSVRGGIVHAQWWSFILAPVYVTVLGIARVRRKRVVITVHNVAPHEGGFVRRLLNRSVLPFADEIIVHSERNRGEVARLAPKKRITVIPHGTLSMGDIGEDDRAGARARLGLPAEDRSFSRSDTSGPTRARATSSMHSLASTNAIRLHTC